MFMHMRLHAQQAYSRHEAIFHLTGLREDYGELFVEHVLPSLPGFCARATSRAATARTCVIMCCPSCRSVRPSVLDEHEVIPGAGRGPCPLCTITSLATMFAGRFLVRHVPHRYV